MDRLSEQLLAGSALASQQYRHVGRRDFLDGAEHPQYPCAVGDYTVDRRCQRGFEEPAVFGFQLEHLAGARNNQLENIDIDRFLIKIVSAEGDCPQGMLSGFVAGGDDDLRRWSNRKDLGQDRQTLGGSVRVGRKPEIDDCH